MNILPKRQIIILAALLTSPTFTAAVELPAPTSDNFCQVAQQILANTAMESYNTVFKNMPDYRASKPFPRPLMTFQVVQYDGQRPIVISCKVKGAAHIRSAVNDDAAGEQLFCPSITRLLQERAVAELTEEGLTDAAAAAASFVIDENEPFMTGRDYLSDFTLSYEGDDGAVHISTPGLFHNYESLTRWILPEKFEGQVYCHLATTEYMKALATGELQPGTVITTADDAPTVPN